MEARVRYLSLVICVGFRGGKPELFAVWQSPMASVFVITVYARMCFYIYNPGMSHRRIIPVRRATPYNRENSEAENSNNEAPRVPKCV